LLDFQFTFSNYAPAPQNSFSPLLAWVINGYHGVIFDDHIPSRQSVKLFFVLFFRIFDVFVPQKIAITCFCAIYSDQINI